MSLGTATVDHLREIAQHATNVAISEKISLSQAVVKCAADSTIPLTSEHVRRICEFTYHAAYDHHYKNSPGSDRWVSFDPPDPVFCAEALHSQKIASSSSKRSAMAANTAVPTTSIQKTAGYSMGPAKFKPANAWDRAMAAAPVQTKTASDPAAAQYQQTQAAIRSLKAQERSIETAEKIAMIHLQECAAQVLRNDNLDIGTVLHACLQSAEPLSEKVAGDVICSLAQFLSTRGFLVPEKVASTPVQVNERHPLPHAFRAAVNMRVEREVVATAIADLQAALLRFSSGKPGYV